MKKNYSILSLLFTFLGVAIIYLGIKSPQSLIIVFLGIVLLITALIISTIAVFKRERISLIFLALFILFLLILPLTKPSNDSFNEWLSDKHQLDCQEKECVSNSESLKMPDGKTEKVVNKEVERVVNRESEDYFFFNKKSIKLEDEDEKGSFFLIEGIGILGGFTTFTYKPVFE
ncbi:NADH-quinone oxidoreductase subunit J [Rummeliibacillus pycnus]|uniref:NADH-quinone oxidoreductase subunit J n=1 Tax=Rummeliibacillus pycnus TaxID=101070 RepID=UPI003D2C7E14